MGHKMNSLKDDLEYHKQSLKTELSKNERISSEIANQSDKIRQLSEELNNSRKENSDLTGQVKKCNDSINKLNSQIKNDTDM